VHYDIVQGVNNNANIPTIKLRSCKQCQQQSNSSGSTWSGWPPMMHGQQPSNSSAGTLWQIKDTNCAISCAAAQQVQPAAGCCVRNSIGRAVPHVSCAKFMQRTQRLALLPVRARNIQRLVSAAPNSNHGPVTVTVSNCCVCLQGLVKLADFGVAAKLGELEEQHNDELHQNVVGTPYWMAPEVRPHTCGRRCGAILLHIASAAAAAARCVIVQAVYDVSGEAVGVVACSGRTAADRGLACITCCYFRCEVAGFDLLTDMSCVQCGLVLLLCC
jgi:hypothetical protein